jgi:hypothetical protein
MAAVMRSPSSLDARVYRAALYLYPPAFRRDFAQEIVRLFDETRQDVLMESSVNGLWRFRARTIADLSVAIVRQWLRTGWPLIAALSVLYPLTAASALSSLWRRLLIVLPRDSADPDVALLEMLAAVVTLIVAATIILTFWFTRPLLERHRKS